MGRRLNLESAEYFALKEKLVMAGESEFFAHAYAQRCKLTDGWESRRRRTPDFDWCILRRGVPGTMRGYVGYSTCGGN